MMLSKERLVALSNRENVGAICAEEIVELARRALASLTAEPVLYAAEETLAYAKMGEPLLKCLSHPTGDAAIPLYTAPPTQVSVPDEIQKLKDGRGFKFVKAGVHYSVNYANGWNQCRAAMLKTNK